MKSTKRYATGGIVPGTPQPARLMPPLKGEIVLDKLTRNALLVVADLQDEVDRLKGRLSTATDKELLLLQQTITLRARNDEPEGVMLALVEPEMELAIVPPPHLNSADALPPVNCPLLIEVDGELLRAERTSFIPKRGDAMVYQLADRQIEGRFKWTYP